jgi:DNA-binding NarL/FixJ family response regulator
MRILLADDQPKLRLGLRLLVEQEPGFKVVGEAADAKSLLAQVKTTWPDLVLLDWELPGLWTTAPATPPAAARGSQVAVLRALAPSLKVIALSGRPEEAQQIALAAGVDAFVSKGDPPERLLVALRMIKERADNWAKDGG